jgi:hypothetical protein
VAFGFRIPGLNNLGYMLPSPFKKMIFSNFFLGVYLFLLIFQNLLVIIGKFSPFTENLLLPVNEILYRTIITSWSRASEVSAATIATKVKLIAREKD